MRLALNDTTPPGYLDMIKEAIRKRLRGWSSSKPLMLQQALAITDLFIGPYVLHYTLEHRQYMSCIREGLSDETFSGDAAFLERCANLMSDLNPNVPQLATNNGYTVSVQRCR